MIMGERGMIAMVDMTKIKTESVAMVTVRGMIRAGAAVVTTNATTARGLAAGVIENNSVVIGTVIEVMLRKIPSG
jgi:hypothetical protein